MNSANLLRSDVSQLSRSAAKDYIDKLRREIRHHDYLYYVKDRPEISDEEYDRLFDALKRVERQFPDLTTPDSPTQRVGAKPAQEFRIVEHMAPMLSLEATREEDDVRRFDERTCKSMNGKAGLIQSVRIVSPVPPSSRGESSTSPPKEG